MKKQINGLDSYNIVCKNCKKLFEGRFWYPSFGSGDGRYCSNCSNLKILEYESQKGPLKCECYGEFNSFRLLCPDCKSVIEDSEKQLASQFYIIEPVGTPGKPTKEELNNWYEARLKERFFRNDELYLFIQLKKVLLFDDEKNEWKYYNQFEV